MSIISIFPLDSNGTNWLYGFATMVSIPVTVKVKSFNGVAPPTRFPGIVIVLSIVYPIALTFPVPVPTATTVTASPTAYVIAEVPATVFQLVVPNTAIE